MQPDSPSILRFNRTPPLFRSVPKPRPERPSGSQHRTKQPYTAAGAAQPHSGTYRAETGKAVEADADRLLRESQGGSTYPIGSSDWMQRAGLNIRKASDAQHLAAIALAYATHVRVSASPLRGAIVTELETLSGGKRSRTTTDLHLVVERFVSYGGESPAERLAARKLISRDVRAIQHLEATKVLPSRVQALAATPGQGLHAWARQSAVTKRVASPPDAIAAKRQAKAEARQRALTHEVTITTRRPDGTRKARQRYAITGVLGSEVAGLTARLRKLAAQTGSAG